MMNGLKRHRISIIPLHRQNVLLRVSSVWMTDSLDRRGHIAILVLFGYLSVLNSGVLL